MDMVQLCSASENPSRFVEPWPSGNLRAMSEHGFFEAPDDVSASSVVDRLHLVNDRAALRIVGSCDSLIEEFVVRGIAEMRVVPNWLWPLAEPRLRQVEIRTPITHRGGPATRAVCPKC